MHIEMYYEGNKFVGEDLPPTAENYSNVTTLIRESVDGTTNTLSFATKNGNTIIVSGEVCKKAVFILKGLPE